jgi:hypothetical protein
VFLLDRKFALSLWGNHSPNYQTGEPGGVGCLAGKWGTAAVASREPAETMNFVPSLATWR